MQQPSNGDEMRAYICGWIWEREEIWTADNRSNDNDDDDARIEDNESIHDINEFFSLSISLFQFSLNMAERLGPFCFAGIWI